jgi:hypothetical protein
MAGRSDIVAGRAFVLIGTKNSDLLKGIAQAKASIQGFGSQLMGIGTWMTGLSGAILGAFGGTIAIFDSMGSKLADLSAKTGVAAGTLGELGYAAGQAGSDLDTLAGAFTKLDKLTAEAFSGDKGAIEFFNGIGLSIAQLKAMKPDEVMEKIADQIAATSNPAERVKIAMDAFGKSGAALIPMLSGGSAGLRAMREEARELGSLTTEEAAAADEFGDALGSLKTLAYNTAAVFGASLVPMARQFVDMAILGGKAVLAWVRDNGQLIQTAAKIAIGIGAAGTALITLGASLWAIGGALGGISAILSAGAFVAPFVGWTAGIGAAVIGVKMLTDNMGSLGGLTDWLNKVFGGMGEYFSGVLGVMRRNFGMMWQGITDAIAAGDLALAMEVAWNGILAVWETGFSEIKGLMNQIKFEWLMMWEQAVAGSAMLISDFFINAARLANFFKAGIAGITGDKAAIDKAVDQELSLRKQKQDARAQLERETVVNQSRIEKEGIEAEKRRRESLFKAQDRLSKSAESAGAKRESLANNPIPKSPALSEIPTSAQLAKTIGPTFSANAIMNMQGGQQDKTVKAVEGVSRDVRILTEINKKILKEAAKGVVFSA